MHLGAPLHRAGGSWGAKNLPIIKCNFVSVILKPLSGGELFNERGFKEKNYQWLVFISM